MSESDPASELEYRAGRWAFLREIREVARYGIVAGYIHHYLTGGAVLDVGCGEALLYPYLDPRRVTRYVGFDVSRTALGRGRIDPGRASLLCVALEDYAPAADERFDAIVFNEVIAFARDPLAEIARYRGFLASGGIIILSIYQTPRETSGARKLTQEIWRMLDRDWTVLDETMLVNVTKNLTWRLRVAR